MGKSTNQTGEKIRGECLPTVCCVLLLFVVFLWLLWQPWEDTPSCTMAGTSAVWWGAGALHPRDELLACWQPLLGMGGFRQGIDGVTFVAQLTPGEPGVGIHFASHGPSKRYLAWRGAKEDWMKGPWGQLPALLLPRSLGVPGLILFLLV